MASSRQAGGAIQAVEAGGHQQRHVAVEAAAEGRPAEAEGLVNGLKIKITTAHIDSVCS